MSTESKAKKNTDYSASAVNLCNPSEVALSISRIKVLQMDIDNLDAVLKSYPEYEQLLERQQEMAQARKEAEQSKEAHGSYQDIEKGWYGIKQRAVAIRYEVGDFEKNYPQFVPAVIVKAINPDALKGLIKGSLITEEGLRNSGVIQEKESFRFVIK